MDRNDGQDIRHYDSGEAIAATQQVGDEMPSGLRQSGSPDSTVDDPRVEAGIDPDGSRTSNTAAGFGIGGTGAGIERGSDSTVAPDDSGAADEADTADTYGEADADLDFDADADPLGMGTDDVDHMITDDTGGNRPPGR